MNRPLSVRDARAGGRLAGPVLLVVGIALAALRPDTPAWAQCTPASGAAAPGTTVTCSGSTTNQDNPRGYGTGAQTGITLNVLSGASVSGTNVGIFLGTGNAITNAGTVSGPSGIVTGAGSTVTNTGSVIANAAGTANGILIQGDGTITSSGPVTSTGGSLSFGLIINGNGTITSSGPVTASSTAGNAFGLVLNHDGNITSSGMVTTTSATGNAFAEDINGNGNITSSGVVTASGVGSVDAEFVGGNGNITNAAAVTATGTTGFASGLRVAGSTGNITNSAAVVTTNGSGESAGVTLQSGNIVNSGAVTTTSATNNAFGLTVNVNGNITNSGAVTTISGTSQVVGLSVFGTGNITNSGPVTVTTTTGNAFGLSVIGPDNITNSAAVTAASGTASAVAIRSNGDGSVVVNSGSAVASTGNASSFARAISLIGNNSTLVNSGSAAAFGGGGNSTAIVLFGTNDTLTLLPGSRIIGPIALAKAGDTVNIVSGHDIASLLTFGTVAGGSFGVGLAGQTINVTGGAPVVINGNQIATLDPTAFALQDRVLMDFTGAASSAIDSRFAEMGSGSGSSTGMSVGYAADTNASAVPFPLKAKAPATDRTTVVWAKAFGGGRSQDADGPDLKASNELADGVLGADWAVNGLLRAGLFGGGGAGRLAVDMNSQTVDTNYGFGGGYGRLDWGGSFLDLKVWGGGSQSSSTRQVANNLAPNGMESATASYNGAFFTPEVAYGRRVLLGDGLLLTPAARLRYVAGWFDGYTESGSAQALTVASRTVQDLEERLEVTVSNTSRATWGQPIDAHATIGVVGIERIGGDAVNGTLIGAPLSFIVPGESAVAGGYLATGFDWHVNASTSVFTGAEATVYSDKSRTGVARGGLRVQY